METKLPSARNRLNIANPPDDLKVHTGILEPYLGGAERAVERRRSAQHVGVRSNGWLGVTCARPNQVAAG